MPLSDIIAVSITRQTASVSQASFNVVGILGSNITAGQRVSYYSDLSSVASALSGGISDPEYQVASAIFKQNPSPNKIALLKIDGAETVTEALTACNIYDSDWYGVVLASRTLADQKLVADWVESNNKIAGFSSDNADIIDDPAEVTSIAYYINNNAYVRSFAFYDADSDGSSDDNFPEASLFGVIFPKDAGTYTAKFKTLSGVSPSTLSTTQETTALDKNCNLYQNIGGKKIVREGKTGDGEFIDIIIFIDWLQARITENTYLKLSRPDKVPFTGDGILTIEQAIDEVLQVGQNRGGISPDAFDDDDNRIGGYNITMPELQNISANDKSNRELNNVKFTAFLAGAIHAVDINGIVTL